MNPIGNARRLRRDQTDEEKELWRALRAGRFAGFKFRRQHPNGEYFLDFYCPAAKLSIELDGFQHGLPEQHQRDNEREKFPALEGIEELRFLEPSMAEKPRRRVVGNMERFASANGACGSGAEGAESLFPTTEG